MFDEKLKFSFHIPINNIVADANKMVRLLRKTVILNKTNFLMLFKTLIRSTFEYNNTVWQCSTKAKEQKIKVVKRRATKMGPGFKNLTYSEHLQTLNLPRLNYHRLHEDCIQVYLKGHYNV